MLVRLIALEDGRVLAIAGESRPYVFSSWKAIFTNYPLFFDDRIRVQTIQGY